MRSQRRGHFYKHCTQVQGQVPWQTQMSDRIRTSITAGDKVAELCSKNMLSCTLVNALISASGDRPERMNECVKAQSQWQRWKIQSHSFCWISSNQNTAAHYDTRPPQYAPWFLKCTRYLLWLLGEPVEIRINLKIFPLFNCYKVIFT